MTLVVTHATLTSAAADPDAIVDGTVWDANHTLTGTASASQLNENVVQVVADDTNVTGDIASQTLTLGWTGTLSPARGGTGVANNAASTITVSGNYGTTFTVTATTSLTLPTSGTVATTSNKLSAFAATTSAELKTVISDETGSGALVFATSPTLVTPDIGVATATSVNKVAVTAPATSATLTLIDGTTLTGPASSGTAMTLGNTETVTGVKTFGSSGAVGRLKIAGTTSGSTVLDATAVASGTLILPAATDTLVGKATTDELTNKTLNASVGKGTWTASGTWTLPAFTLGGTVSGNSQTISGLTSLIIGTPPTITGGLVYNGGSDRVFAFGLAGDGPILTAVNTANDAYVPIYIDAASIHLRPSGTSKLSAGTDVTVRPDVATPEAGSTSARLLFGTTSGFGIYYGYGAPTVSAAQGSIYLRADGSSTSTRLYVNTTGSTTWTNVTTAA